MSRMSRMSRMGRMSRMKGVRGMLPRPVRRVAGALLVPAAVSVLVFAATEAAPGDAATARLGPGADPAQVAGLRAELGLDRPAPVRYLDWLGHAVRGDLGVSYASGRPVALETNGTVRDARGLTSRT